MYIAGNVYYIVTQMDEYPYCVEAPLKMDIGLPLE